MSAILLAVGLVLGAGKHEGPKPEPIKCEAPLKPVWTNSGKGHQWRWACRAPDAK
jgi:hypothetical protein